MIELSRPRPGGELTSLWGSDPAPEAMGDLPRIVKPRQTLAYIGFVPSKLPAPTTCALEGITEAGIDRSFMKSSFPARASSDLLLRLEGLPKQSVHQRMINRYFMIVVPTSEDESDANPVLQTGEHAGRDEPAPLTQARG